MNNEPMRIVYLEAENVKRLRAVRIRPDKTLVRIEGRNAQGKSSVLDAIAAALGGGKWQPEMPVRKGQKKAHVKLEIGDLVVERRWTAAGGTMLEITQNGSPQRSPQAILDKLVGDLTFDPLAFAAMKPQQQAQVLKQLAGLDFSELDMRRERLFAGRTVVNRDAKNAEANVGPMPATPTSGPVNVRELADQQQAALSHNRKCEDVRAAVQRANEWYERAELALGAAQAELEKARLTRETARENAAKWEPVPVADLGSAIAEAERHNRAIVERQNWERISAHAKAKSKEADNLTEQIEEIDAERQARLQAAKFPLEGLSLDPLGPTLNGIPFSQASSAEQLRTSVAIGLASKPQARIMLCRDGSLLDHDNLTALHAIAEEFDAQVFIERVADAASPGAIYIEDGEVVEEGGES